MALLLESLDSTPMKFLSSPLCIGSLSLLSPLFIYIYIGLCIDTYSFHWWKRDLNLLREGEVVPSEKHINTSDLGFLIYILPFSSSFILDKHENAET